ncbi:ABC transporter substrate-binding protein [Limnochorda pilosa]|uniref:ABC transporter substrate-binding protein n=1 Tax=Limnochorda pilosa TaxID=1555112 RepID=UPI00130E733B|nr:sugar ABC transporter substrate-binding protein [Limnochorda pilosa]
MLLISAVNVTGARAEAARISINWWSTPAWSVDGDVYGWQKQMIAEFEASHPDVEVDLTQLSWADATTKLNTAIMARRFPDLVSGGQPATWALQGILEPVDPYLSDADQADYYPAALQKYTVNGSIYGWPWFTTTYVIYLNLDIFKERGVQPPVNGNWTWDEFVEKARQLTFKGEDGQQVYGFGAIMQPWYYQSFGILLSDGGRLVSEDGKRFMLNTPEGVSGLGKLVDLVQRYKVSPLAMGSVTDADMTKMFTDGHLAMLAQGTFLIRSLEKALQEGNGFNFGIANYPIGQLGRPVSLHEGVGGFVVFKQTNSEKRDAVMEFARFITSPENQKALSNYGVFPSRKSVGNIYPNDEYLAWAQREAVPTLVIPPVAPSWLEADRAIVPFFQLAILGNAPAEQAMRDAETAANRILGK